jgi:hypothetical protein
MDLDYEGFSFEESLISESNFALITRRVFGKLNA